MRDNKDIPPLPPLVTWGMEQRVQEYVDAILNDVYARRPDLFAKLGEAERRRRAPNDDEKKFDTIVEGAMHRVMRETLPQPDEAGYDRFEIHFKCEHTLKEAKRRVRIMYGIDDAQGRPIEPLIKRTLTPLIHRLRTLLGKPEKEIAFIYDIEDSFDLERLGIVFVGWLNRNTKQHYPFEADLYANSKKIRTIKITSYSMVKRLEFTKPAYTPLSCSERFDLAPLKNKRCWLVCYK